jgi:3'-5' exonuclease
LSCSRIKFFNKDQQNCDGDGGIVMENPSDKKNVALGLPVTSLKIPATTGVPYLQLEELVVRSGKDENDRNDDVLQYIRLIHTIETVQEFAAHLSNLRQSLATTVEAATAAADAGTVLVGMDCEWKPNFLAESSKDRHPVLLLQVCVYRLANNSINSNMNEDKHAKTTKKENLVAYLLDLQQLLRPGMSPGTEMNPLEQAVSDALYDLFSSTRLIKTGFQLVNDLRRMASSYPHVTAFQQEIHAVLEASTFAKLVLQMTRKNQQQHQPQQNTDLSPQTVIRSLSSLTQHVLGKALDKTEQISDWSQRPLTKTQMKYAALDAVVAPVLVERLMTLITCQIFYHEQNHPKLGRNENDKAFRQAIMSWRFCLFSQIKDSRAILRLRATNICVDNDKQNDNDDDEYEWHLVSQKWITAEPPPKRPLVPRTSENAMRKRTNNNELFTDEDGKLRVSSKLVAIFNNNDEDRATITDSILKTMVGQRVGKSKEACVAVLIQQAALASSSSSSSSRNTAFPDGALVDFPQRSGYIELADTVLLFVNMQTVKNRQRRARSYPNDVLDNGQVLTWFLRENDWKNGRSSLAQKLTSPPTVLDTDAATTTNASSTPPLAILFLRLDKGHFLCCGRCCVTAKTEPGVEETAEWGSLVQLYLNLLDWNTLIDTSSDFVELVHPGRAQPYASRMLHIRRRM